MVLKVRGTCVFLPPPFFLLLYSSQKPRRYGHRSAWSNGSGKAASSVKRVNAAWVLPINARDILVIRRQELEDPSWSSQNQVYSCTFTTFHLQSMLLVLNRFVQIKWQSNFSKMHPRWLTIALWYINNTCLAKYVHVWTIERVFYDLFYCFTHAMNHERLWIKWYHYSCATAYYI